MVEMSLQTAQEGAPGITADALGDSSAASSVGALDVIYLVNCLSIGGSEKKTVGLVNRLSERGVRVGLVRLNAPDALLSHLQGGVPAWCLERKGKFSPAAVARLQRIIAATRPGALVAVNL